MEQTSKQAKPISADPSIANFTTSANVTDQNKQAGERRGSEKRTSIHMPGNVDKENTDSIKQQPQKQPENKPDEEGRPAGSKSKDSKLGGVINTKAGGIPKQSQEKDIVLDLSAYLDLDTLLEALEKGQELKQLELKKIQSNFLLYVKNNRQPEDIKSIMEEQDSTGKDGKPAKVIFLKLSYLNGLDVRSKLTLNEFFKSVIVNLCEKLPFLSYRGCLNVIKLFIHKKKDTYCSKSNKANLNVELFMIPSLFPIVNEKISIKVDHPFYLNFFDQIQNFISALFKSWKIIFQEISRMQKNNKEVYNNVFKKVNNDEFTKKSQSKSSFFRNIAQRMIASFISVVELTRSSNLIQFIKYLDCLTSSMWSYFQFAEKYFIQVECISFLKLLHENYKRFNIIVNNSSQLGANDLKENLERLILGFLFKNPFDFSSWNQQIKNIVFNSNFLLFTPFVFLIEKRLRRQDQFECYQYLNGIHWNTLLQKVLLIKQDDEDRNSFVINSLSCMLKENSDEFWQNIDLFTILRKWVQNYYDKEQSKNSLVQLKQSFCDILKIAIALMGKSQEERMLNDKKQKIYFELQYPQNQRYDYALKVYNEFSLLFLKVSKQEFIETFLAQMSMFLIPDERNKISFRPFQNLQSNSLTELEYTLKQYCLKLIVSQPSFLYQLLKNLSRQTKQEQLIIYLIFDTISNANSPKELTNLAFSALDALLNSSQTSLKLTELLFPKKEISEDIVEIIHKLFSRSEAFSFVARHCSLLINLDYQDQQWTKLILDNCSIKIRSSKKVILTRQPEFLLSYLKLTNDILCRLNSNSKKQIAKAYKLKKYVNMQLIIQCIKHHLKFNNSKRHYFNTIVVQQKKTLNLILMETIRLFNIILTYQLSQTTRLTNSLEGKPSKISNYNLNSQSYFSTLQMGELGVQNNNYEAQVSSPEMENTTYVNALVFILISTNQIQKKLLLEVNKNYQDLVFETIENLIKLNPRQNLRRFFVVYKQAQTLQLRMHQEQSSEIVQYSSLNEFISFTESKLDSTGIQIIIFGNLIEQPQRLRTLIDKVRIRLQNQVRKNYIKPSLILKALATLSRYLYRTISQMCSKKSPQFSMSNFQIKQHIDYLLLFLITSVQPYRRTKIASQMTKLDHILQNIYKSMSEMQNLSRSQFVRWMKNYHPIILSPFNLKYRRQYDRGTEDSTPEETLSKEYVKLLQLFLNSKQYLSDTEFTSMTDIKDFSKKIPIFIKNIIEGTDFNKIDMYTREILLQIVISAIGFGLNLKQNAQYTQSLLLETLQLINQKRQTLGNSQSLVILETILSNELKIPCQNFKEADFFEITGPLKLNCINDGASSINIKNLVENLRRDQTTDFNFVSICNGFLQIVQNSVIPWSQSGIIRQLIAVYKNWTRQESHNFPRFSTLSQNTLNTNSKTEEQKSFLIQKASSRAYRRIWILQILVSILTISQGQSRTQQYFIETQFQKLFIYEDDMLSRFGSLIKKISFEESQTDLKWIPGIEIKQQSQPSKTSYAEKLEFLQILKIMSFLIENSEFSQFTDRYRLFIEHFLAYRKIFQKLPFSSKKPKPWTKQQINLSKINILMLLNNHMLSSGIKHFEKQKLSGATKSQNCFQLLHEVINFQIATAFSTFCITIANHQDLNKLKSNPLLTNLSLWNVVLLDLAQSLSKKHIQMIKYSQPLKSILNGFTDKYYLTSGSLSISEEMLFTNSNSLSCSLNTSFEGLKELSVEILTLLFESIVRINNQLSEGIDFKQKSHKERYMTIVAALKKVDQFSFQYTDFVDSEKKMSQYRTIRSQATKTFEKVSQKSQRINQKL